MTDREERPITPHERDRLIRSVASSFALSGFHLPREQAEEAFDKALAEPLPIVLGAEMEARLEEYERAYGMSSTEFLARWRGGDASLDKHEYFAWVGLCDMALRSGLLSLAEDDLGCRDLPQPHAHSRTPPRAPR